ncbi:hypothetical protein BU26DRAFT_508524 [Trematosphaeria pertusa]|uniref:Uncharacterized protein n=1 Tax=Trematosphaeria pertusa TaxID=390896 RepID=A0A6A6I4I4_9PLEO|nr:uncharacterized protein BU26DRAFT_508524 [Trematosphaeria pertusa]KAF2245216.1 hypothetical protein BU26DRAFT_508524 [Trematosphaeria pertusa]
MASRPLLLLSHPLTLLASFTSASSSTGPEINSLAANDPFTPASPPTSSNYAGSFAYTSYPSTMQGIDTTLCSTQDPNDASYASLIMSPISVAGTNMAQTDIAQSQPFKPM